VEKFGMTPILREDKGKEEAAIQLSLSEKIVPVNRRFFLPPIHTRNIVIPKLIHPLA
jgi:hypothetical protein